MTRLALQPPTPVSEGQALAPVTAFLLLSLPEPLLSAAAGLRGGRQAPPGAAGRVLLAAAVRVLRKQAQLPPGSWVFLQQTRYLCVLLLSHCGVCRTFREPHTLTVGAYCVMFTGELCSLK